MGNTTATTGTTPDQKILMERLRADCDVAFRNWTAQVRILQSVSAADPQDLGAVEQARRWADEAAAVYRAKRNLFMEFLIRSQEAAGNPHALSADAHAAGPDSGSSKERMRKVEKLARQIWEESGRPPGTAEHDWYQAEQILNTRR
jgi:hypothetical protein